MPTQTAFERFSRLGDKHAFRRRDGRDVLGWVMEVGETALLFAHAPSPFYAQATAGPDMAPPDEWIAFEEIEPSSLAFYDTHKRRWIDFVAGNGP